MGAIKFIIIAALIIYLFYRFTNFIFKILLGVLGGGQNSESQTRRTRPKDGNVEVEYDAREANSRNKRGPSASGEGEYIEYEEVK